MKHSPLLYERDGTIWYGCGCGFEHDMGYHFDVPQVLKVQAEHDRQAKA